jgi:hypothetical protein
MPELIGKPVVKVFDGVRTPGTVVSVNAPFPAPGGGTFGYFALAFGRKLVICTEGDFEWGPDPV